MLFDKKKDETEVIVTIENKHENSTNTNTLEGDLAIGGVIREASEDETCAQCFVVGKSNDMKLGMDLANIVAGILNDRGTLAKIVFMELLPKKLKVSE